jgi:hypothetical protein
LLEVIEEELVESFKGIEEANELANYIYYKVEEKFGI